MSIPIPWKTSGSPYSCEPEHKLTIKGVSPHEKRLSSLWFKQKRILRNEWKNGAVFPKDFFPQQDLREFSRLCHNWTNALCLSQERKEKYLFKTTGGCFSILVVVVVRCTFFPKTLRFQVFTSKKAKKSICKTSVWKLVRSFYSFRNDPNSTLHGFFQDSGPGGWKTGSFSVWSDNLGIWSPIKCRGKIRGKPLERVKNEVKWSKRRSKNTHVPSYQHQKNSKGATKNKSHGPKAKIIFFCGRLASGERTI